MVSFEQKQERIALQVELEAKEREFQRTKKQIGQLIKGCSRRTPPAPDPFQLRSEISAT